MMNDDGLSSSAGRYPKLYLNQPSAGSLGMMMFRSFPVYSVGAGGTFKFFDME